MADEHTWAGAPPDQRHGGLSQISHIRGNGCGCHLPAAVAEPGEIEAIVRYPPPAKPLAMRVVVNRSFEQVKQ